MKNVTEQELLLEAADWFDRQDELCPQELQRFVTWLEQPGHLTAYQRICRAMGAPELAQAIAMSKASKVNEDTKVVSLLSETETPATKQRKQFGPKSWWMMAASFAALALLLMALHPDRNMTSPHVAERQSPATQTLIAQVARPSSQILSDGSQVHLNARSELHFSETALRRNATLTQGQAYFDVARDESRPFVIDAGLARIQVLGTSFDVDRLEDSVWVTVYSGHVQVQQQQTYDLFPGQRIGVFSNGQVVQQQHGNSQLPDWRMGWLDVQQESMAQVLTRLERYLDKPVILKDPQLKQLEVSGRFALTRPQDALHMLAQANALRLVEQADHYYLSSR